MTACAFFCHGLIFFFFFFKDHVVRLCAGRKKSIWCVVLYVLHFFSLSSTLREMSLNAACWPDRVECSWWWRGIIAVRKNVALNLCWEKIMKIVQVSDFGKRKIRICFVCFFYQEEAEDVFGACASLLTCNAINTTYLYIFFTQSIFIK